VSGEVEIMDSIHVHVHFHVHGVNNDELTKVFERNRAKYNINF
jgi:hypothetical protein